MDAYEINWLAVLVGALSSFAVGGLWYSPLLFAKPWMAAIGKTEDELRGAAGPLPYIVAFVATAISAIVLSMVADWAGVDDFLSGALLGLIVGIGLIATAYTTTYAFEGRPTALLLINAGHDIARAVVVGAIVGGWQ